jgi:hypothetical protein
MPSAAAARLRGLLLVGSAVLAGCGGLATPYADHGPKNLILAPSRTSSSFFASRAVRMDIYRGAKIDRGAYLGTVHMTGAVQHIGVPVGVPLLLHIGFKESGLLMSTVVSAQRVPLTVRPGERYQLSTEYGDGGFDYRLDRMH